MGHVTTPKYRVETIGNIHTDLLSRILRTTK
jgi:hypothetical protein